PDNQNLTPLLRSYYTDLAAFYKRRGQHAELAALANQLRGDFLDKPEETYYAARLLAYAARVVAQQQALPPPQRDALSEEHAAASVAMLDKAITEGLANRPRIE